MKALTVYSGDPIYHGGPSPQRVKAIDALTLKDYDDDRLYYREKLFAHWKPLVTEEDYRKLNAAVDVLAHVLEQEVKF